MFPRFHSAGPVNCLRYVPLSHPRCRRPPPRQFNSDKSQPPINLTILFGPIETKTPHRGDVPQVEFEVSCASPDFLLQIRPIDSACMPSWYLHDANIDFHPNLDFCSCKTWGMKSYHPLFAITRHWKATELDSELPILYVLIWKRDRREGMAGCPNVVIFPIKKWVINCLLRVTTSQGLCQHYYCWVISRLNSIVLPIFSSRDCIEFMRCAMGS